MPSTEPQNAAVRYGAGTLRVAPLGSLEPTSVSSAWDAAWTKLGYTEAGSTFSFQLAITPLEVAELYDPVKYITTGRTLSLAFNLAEMTKKSLSIAFNGGVLVQDGTSTTFEPPPVGTEVRVMLGWDALDGLERWVYRQCVQTGQVSIARGKAAEASVPITMNLEPPDTGLPPFKAFLAGILNIA